MSDRDWLVLIEDIQRSCGKILRYTKNMNSLEEFVRDEKTVDAVIRNLEVIGEAAKRIPQDIRARYGSIPWRAIAGLRDVLIHGYASVNYRIVWDIVENEVPALKDELDRILKEHGAKDEGA